MDCFGNIIEYCYLVVNSLVFSEIFYVGNWVFFEYVGVLCSVLCYFVGGYISVIYVLIVVVV